MGNNVRDFQIVHERVVRPRDEHIGAAVQRRQLFALRVDARDRVDAVDAKSACESERGVSDNMRVRKHEKRIQRNPMETRETGKRV